MTVVVDVGEAVVVVGLGVVVVGTVVVVVAAVDAVVLEVVVRVVLVTVGRKLLAVLVPTIEGESHGMGVGVLPTLARKHCCGSSSEKHAVKLSAESTAIAMSASERLIQFPSQVLRGVRRCILQHKSINMSILIAKSVLYSRYL